MFENKNKQKSKLIDISNIIDNQKPILIFGGNYSNLEATQTLKHWAEKQGFLPQQCICTGDIVAYCGNPVETTDLIHDWGVHCIQGNVEQSLAIAADDCGCGFESGTACDVLSKGWYSFADRLMSQSHRNWFQAMPQHLHFSYANKQIFVVHGAASNINRFMFASQKNQGFVDELELCDADLIIAGHSGLPFTKKIAHPRGDLVWHNSGALGMPANDGTPRVWFSILKCLDGQIQFTQHSLSYDYHLTKKTMLNNNLNQGYHNTLSTGLWPSMDVLPELEKSQQGKPLSFCE